MQEGHSYTVEKLRAENEAAVTEYESKLVSTIDEYESKLASAMKSHEEELAALRSQHSHELSHELGRAKLEFEEMVVEISEGKASA
eukprot:1775612-Rhodomonas_salina.1